MLQEFIKIMNDLVQVNQTFMSTKQEDIKKNDCDCNIEITNLENQKRELKR